MQKNSTRRACLLIGLVLALATAAAYWPLRGNQFINYDDQDYLTSNPDVQSGLTWEGIGWAFTTGYAGNWHPLTWVSHMLDWQLYGPDAGGHHVTNLVIHTTNVLLLFLLLWRITGALARSALVAALFALHPLHVESVAWASERKDVLSALFFLLTLWAYSRYAARLRLRPADNVGTRRAPPAWTLYALSVLLFACGLMSKPMLVTLPFLLLLLDYWPLQRWQHSAGQRGFRLRLLLEKTPFFLLAALSSVITFIVQRKTGTVSSMDILPLDARFENSIVSSVLYLEKTVWPVRLAPFYPYIAERPFVLLLFSAAFLLGITSAVLIFSKRAPYLTVGWFWYLGMLVPVIGLVQVGIQSMADRYTYLPLLGIFIAAVWGAADLARRWSAARVPGLAFVAILLLVCLALTHRQVNRWRNSETLFRHTLEVTRNNPVAHHCFGCVLVEQGKIEEAEQHFAETVRLQPSNFEARNNLGLALVIRGRVSEAIEQYQAVLNAHPTFAKTHYNLGRALELQGELEPAITHYERAVQLESNYTAARRSLAIALEKSGQIQPAIQHFAELLRVKPEDADARFDFSNLLAKAGSLQEAIRQIELYLQARPDDPEAYERLGLFWAQQGRGLEAGRAFTEALRLRPNARAHYNLALARVLEGKPREAASEYREALGAEPDYPLALNDLAWILATNPEPALRDGAEAVRLAERACELSGRKVARFLGTLDAAYAEAGRFADAELTAQQTAALATASGQGDLAQAARERLTYYRAGKPFRE